MASEQQIQGPRMKKKWSEQDTIRFLNLYEAEEVLWNSRIQDYKNKDARNAALYRIVQNMNMDGFAFFATKDDVTYKINNIRSTYGQEKLKIKKSIEAEADVYVPSLIWFDIADRFLSKVVKIKKIPTSVSSHVKLNTHKKSEEIPASPLVPAVSSPDLPGQSLDIEFIAPQQSTRKGMKRTHQHIETLQLIQDQLNNRVEDEFYYFGENIACQLRQLPLLDALDTQSEILKLIVMKRRSVYQLQSSSKDSQSNSAI